MGTKTSWATNCAMPTLAMTEMIASRLEAGTRYSSLVMRGGCLTVPWSSARARKLS